jgi:hypothetical protein
VANLDLRVVDKDLRARVKDWRELLGLQTPIGRQIVAKLLDEKRIVFTPLADARRSSPATRTLGNCYRGLCYRRYGVPQPVPLLVTSLFFRGLWLSHRKVA